MQQSLYKSVTQGGKLLQQWRAEEQARGASLLWSGAFSRRL